jgi:hypothetical protein
MAKTVLSEIIKTGTFKTREFASLEAEREYAAARVALDAEAKENWGNSAWHREQAATIAETLDYGFRFDNTFSNYFPVTNVGEFEQVTIRERRGMKVFYTNRGGEIDESQISTDIWELQKDTMGWHVSEFEDNVRANYSETIQDLLPLAKQREDAEVNRRIFTMLKASVPSGSASYEDLTLTGLTEAALRAAVTAVSDVPRPSNGSLERPLAIVGRKGALAKILDFTTYSNITQDLISRTGQMGSFFGANLINLDNYQDEDGIAYLPANEIWVFGGNVGLFATYGGSRVKMWTEDKVDYTHFKSRRDVGGAAFHPEYCRRLVLSA